MNEQHGLMIATVLTALFVTGWIMYRIVRAGKDDPSLAAFCWIPHGEYWELVNARNDLMGTVEIGESTPLSSHTFSAYYCCNEHYNRLIGIYQTIDAAKLAVEYYIKDQINADSKKEN